MPWFLEDELRNGATIPSSWTFGWNLAARIVLRFFLTLLRLRDIGVGMGLAPPFHRFKNKNDNSHIIYWRHCPSLSLLLCLVAVFSLVVLGCFGFVPVFPCLFNLCVLGYWNSGIVRGPPLILGTILITGAVGPCPSSKRLCC